MCVGATREKRKRARHHKTVLIRDKSVKTGTVQKDVPRPDPTDLSENASEFRLHPDQAVLDAPYVVKAWEVLLLIRRMPSHSDETAVSTETQTKVAALFSLSHESGRDHRDGSLTEFPY